MTIFHLLLKYLGERTQERVALGVARAVAPVGPYLKQISLGLGCLALSVVCFLLTLIFLAGALFLQLAHGADWSIPALWTSLASTVIGSGFVFGGISFLKKKYRPEM